MALTIRWSQPLAVVTALAAAAFGCSSTAAGAAGPAPSPAPSGPPAPGPHPALLELYTSQGCSSCPAADALVHELPSLGFTRDRVIPLTFHVDYWDRLGWTDPFASAANTRRQTRYARSNRLRPADGSSGIDGLYTPQMIVNGTVHFSGQRRQTALRELERAAARPPAFELDVKATFTDSGAELSVKTSAHAPGTGGTEPVRAEDWRLLAALAMKQARTRVARGENAGETLAEAAIVRVLSDRTPLPAAGAAAHIRLNKPADLAALSWSELELVVFAQSETTLEIGAVRAVP